MLREYSSASERISAPCHRISPLSGIINPHRMRIRLVFPLPFGPVSCRNVPGAREKLMSLKRRRSPRTHRRLETSKIVVCSPGLLSFRAAHCIELFSEKHFSKEDTDAMNGNFAYHSRWRDREIFQ